MISVSAGHLGAPTEGPMGRQAASKGSIRLASYEWVHKACFICLESASTYDRAQTHAKYFTWKSIGPLLADGHV